MKITLPLYNQRLRGLMPGVGIFRDTMHGAVLTAAYVSLPENTTSQQAVRRRFVSLRLDYAAGYAALPETAAHYIARRITADATNHQPTNPNRIELATADHPLNLAHLLPLHAIN